MRLESDGELGRLLGYQIELTSKDNHRLDNLQEEKQLHETERSRLSGIFSAKSTERGVLQVELKRLSDKETTHCLLLDQLCAVLSVVSGPDHDQTLTLATAKLQDQQDSLGCVEAEAKNSDLCMAAKVQQLATKHSSVVECKRMKRKAIDDAQRKLAGVLDQITDISAAKDQLDELQIRLAEEESSLNQARHLFDAAEYDARHSTMVQRRRAVDESIASLHQKVASCTQFADLRAKVQWKRGELDRKNDSVGKIWAEVKSDLESITGLDLTIGGAEKECDRLWRTKERQLKALQEHAEKVNASHSIVQSKYEHAKGLHARKERELHDKSKRIKIFCERGDFEGFIQEVEREFEETTRQLTVSLSAKSTYEAFQAAFSKNSNCPLCERAFDKTTEEDGFAIKVALGGCALV